MFFKKKDQKVDKKFVIFLTAVLLVAVLSASFYVGRRFLNNPNVSVSTNKRTYREGENVEILIFNKRETPVYFIQNNGVATRVWDIQIMNNGEWVESKEPIFGNEGRYVLESKGVDSEGKCTFPRSRIPQLHFSSSKAKLSPEETKKVQWDQFGCLISVRSDDVYVKTAARGMYRVYFEYSYDRVGEDGSIITEKEVVYSRPFYLK